MQGFGPSTYGDSFADVYDDWYANITDAEATAAFVAARRAEGPVLELGVGSGRLVPALVAAGCDVIGVDASAGMLANCAERIAAEGVHSSVRLVRADLAALPLTLGSGSSRPGAALCAFNTLFNLPTEAEQLALLESLATVIDPSGVVIVEAITGNALADGPASSVGVSRLTTDRLVLSATLLDCEAQTISGQHVDISETGITMRPWLLRWTTPGQLDELARSVGLELVERFADWSETPFDDEADNHISVYRSG